MLFNLGFSNKSYIHDMSYHVDTTADFGHFQPIAMQFLNENDKVNIKNFAQLVRNAVMPSPTFGRIRCINDFIFVPISDVFRQYSALISGTSINTRSSSYIPTSVPSLVPSKILGYMLYAGFFEVSLFETTVSPVTNDHIGPLTFGGHIGSYTRASGSFSSRFKDEISKELSGSTTNIIESILKAVCPGFALASYSWINDVYSRDLSMNECDFLFTSSDTPSDTNVVQFVGLRLTRAGRNVYKILQGLGYTFDFSSTVSMSLLPLFAFYKAWYDKYAPQRYSNFQQTSLYRLIDEIYELGRFNDYNVEFKNFLLDLSDCIYTYPDMYESIHQLTPLDGVDKNSTPSLVNDFMTSSLGANVTAKTTLPTIINNSYATAVTLQTISRLTKFLTKNSLIGKRVDEYLTSHFGAHVRDSLFPQSNYISQMVTDININDMISSVDTYNSNTGDGSLMGSRAAKGDGFSNNSLFFDAKQSGFFIGMCAVVPEFQFYQGFNQQLQMIDRFSFPHPEFDALGYEVTPKSAIYDNNGIIFSNTMLKDSGFGFVPRYSAYKHARNIVNGDMRLRSTRNTFVGYYLDAQITPVQEYVEVKNVPDSTSSTHHDDSHDEYTMRVSAADIPVAGPLWRKLLSYPQLNYFNRIFLNSGFSNRSSLRGSIDNFTIQCNIVMEVSNKLKPLSQSFDTFDEEVDNDVKKVRNV